MLETTDLRSIEDFGGTGGGPGGAQAPAMNCVLEDEVLERRPVLEDHHHSLTLAFDRDPRFLR